MDIVAALIVLEHCDWLKITQRHVSASKWKSRAEMSFVRGDPSINPYPLKSAEVSIRRKKSETFESLLIRAASLVEAGHVPVVRVPPQTSADRCQCGTTSHDLIWNDQLHQRVCRRCYAAWASAANTNDIGPTTTTVQ
ncbi:MAG: hypothetical protein WC718_19130 [Phycisphaerales bacterium]|jgi:hypothetical protein